MNSKFQGLQIKFLLFYFLLIISNEMSAQKNVMIDSALIPFWKDTIMYNESVLMISKNGELPQASLLYKPNKIISVKNSALDSNFNEGVDWEYKGGKLILLKGSKAAYLTEKQLYPDTSINAMPKKGGGFLFFQEGSFFHTHQLAVTYSHSIDAWKGPVTKFQGGDIPLVMNKLKRELDLKILLFGDSIAAGSNASAKVGSSPLLPSWGNLVVEYLRRHHKGDISFINTSVGGKDTQWGLANVQEKVIANNPDLVIIAFGMNDGKRGVAPDVFKSNVQEMINKIRGQNSNVEFILVAPIIPNPESTFVGTQSLFKNVLNDLKGQGVVVVDMTSIHSELLKYKTYQDMTGNNINHPNDFLIRWYAQLILSALIPGYSN